MHWARLFSVLLACLLLAIEANGGERAFGPPIEPRAAAPNAERPRVCSFRYPVCVHSDLAPSTTLAVLSEVEQAWELITGAFALPPPLADWFTPYRVYLVVTGAEAEQGEAQTLLDGRDVRSTIDRASAFSLVPSGLTGCTRKAMLLREVARASLWGVSPATDPGTATAQTEALARLAVPCTELFEPAVGAFQRAAERALPETSSALYSRGASLFYEWLDGFAMEPGGLVRGSWALAATKTAPGALRWEERPDVFDVFRTTFAGALGTRTTFDDVLVRFAVARASMSPSVSWAWDIPWPSKGRRLQSSVGIAPTGGAYVRVSCVGAPAGGRLYVKSEWEEHAGLRWGYHHLDFQG
jgi:hypothetical protein